MAREHERDRDQHQSRAPEEERARSRARWREQEREGNAEIIAGFRANGGEVAAPYPDPPPTLLLHTVGARSGKEHGVPMRGLPDGGAFSVIASAHGGPRHPDWYRNLLAYPEIDVEVGSESVPMRATELHGAARDAVFARRAARFPVFAEDERKLDRSIPVVRLDRRPVRRQRDRPPRGRRRGANRVAGDPPPLVR